MVLKIENLQTYFHTYRGVVKAVDGVSLALKQGETLGIVGESGSGKSITALSIMRLIDAPGKVEGGTIEVDGRNILDLPERAMEKIRGKEISMIFQDPMRSLNPCYSVGFQIGETIDLHQSLTTSEKDAEILRALKRVSIPSPESRLKDYPFQLSGGMRQRVMIAMAMACCPKILIADEPTTALDVTIQAQILSLMRALQEEQNTAILFITHDLGVISQMAHRVAVMYTGRIVEEGPMEKIFAKPLHPYTEGLLKSLPSQNKTAKKAHLYTIPDRVPNPHNLPSGCTFWPRCPYAQEKCKQKNPALQVVEEGHSSACWKALGDLT